MPFSQIIPPSPSPAESKRLFYTSLSLLLSRVLPLDGTHPEILPLDDFPAISSSLICLLCLWSHLPSLMCTIFYCWGFAVSMPFHFA